MSRHIFIFVGLSLLVLSLPERYSSYCADLGTSVFSTLFASASSSSSQMPQNEEWNAWKKNSEEEMHEVIDYSARALKEKYASIVAEVMHQSATPWTHVLWIDKGSKTPDLPFPMRRNCPVLVGSTLVGIIDFVGNYSSRIRLLSDPAVHPAVRVARGGYMPRQAIFMAHELELMLQKNPSLMPSEPLAQKLSTLLNILSENVQQEVDMRLAKGELQGCDSPDSPHIFRGTGFNCDFADEECPKRDLRTGQQDAKDQQMPLIKPGDILETSGLDGCFPKGLEVALATKVAPLEEGAICYNILAKSIAAEFSSLEYVTIIPALAEGPLLPHTNEEKIMSLIKEAQ
jgi:rod shape-determining protein MreC